MSTDYKVFSVIICRTLLNRANVECKIQSSDRMNVKTKLRSSLILQNRMLLA